MIKKNFSKKTKSFLLIFLSSFFLASCAEDKPKWYDKYLNKANSIFSDYDTYSNNYQKQIIGNSGFLNKLYSDSKYFPFWNFRKNFSLDYLKKKFTFDDKDSFKNCKIALNYLFPLDASKEEPKGNVVIEGYFLVPNDNNKSKNDDVEKNYYIPVNFVFTNKEDLSVIEINNDFPDIFSETTPYNFFYWKNINDIFFENFEKNFEKYDFSKDEDDLLDYNNFSKADMDAFNEVKKDFFADFILNLKIKNFKFTSSDDTKNLSKAPEGVCLNALILWNETSNKKIGSNYNISVNFSSDSDFNFKNVINNHYKDYIKIKLFKI